MEKEKGSFGKFLNILTTVIFVPIFVISLVASILMFSAKQHNEVPSLFGLSAVVVLTTSMEDGGFAQGDYVMVQRKNVSTLNEGDIIAFYGYYKYDYELEDVVNPGTSQSSPASSSMSIGAFTEGQKEAASKGSPVIFHRITRIVAVKNKDGIFDSNDPTCYFFFTKGDSNGSEDPAIRGDMVVGAYYPEGNWLTTIFKFCSSIAGIIVLVLVPTGILLILIVRSIIEQIAEMKLEKDLNKKTQSQYAFVIRDDGGEEVSSNGDEDKQSDEPKEKENE